MGTTAKLGLLLCAVLVGACTGDRGKTGAAGLDGEQGEQGEPGEPGAAGDSCTVEDNGDGTKTITCEDGTTVDIADGAVGDSCTIEDNGDGTKTITCGEDTVDVADGSSCTVVDNGDGTKTLTCDDGTSVDISDGAVGPEGEGGRNAYLAGPGIVATIEGVTIAGGVATVTFTVADGDGNPLDVDGVYSQGPVSLRFLLAWLDDDGAGNARQYTSYITNADGLAAAERPSSESGGGAAPPKGTLTLLDWTEGRYEYEFATPVTVDAGNMGKTHTVALTASRTVDEVTEHDNVTHDFRPDAAAVTVTRQIVTTENCNACHSTLGLHGGRRKEVGVCIMCHQPQSNGADGVVDMPVMIHKIHMGDELPSVVAGGTYEIGNADFSEVAFPRERNDCAACHGGAPQGSRYQTYSAAICSTCHDTTSFVEPAPAGMTLHSGGSQPDDSQCAVCHRAGGFAPSIDEAHATKFANPAADIVVAEIVSVSGTGPAGIPVLTFRISVNGTYRDIQASPIDRIRAYIAGPTTEYAWRMSGNIQGSSANGTLTNPSGDHINFEYTFPSASAVPANASGSATFAMEARTSYTDALGVVTTYPARNPVITVAVTDAQPVVRRTVVEQDRCESCHERFESFHGGARSEVTYCPMCHNWDRMAGTQRFETLNGAPFSVERQSLQFRDMVHGIHRGEDRENPITLYSGVNSANPGGTSATALAVLYPGILSNCSQCHADGTWTLEDTSDWGPSQYPIYTCSEDPTLDVDSYCTDPYWTSVIVARPPVQAACLACHDSDAAKAHAELNTTDTGDEACAVCHGPGSDFEAHPE